MILRWIFFVFILPVAIWLVVVFSGCIQTEPHKVVKKSQLSDWTIKYVEDPSTGLCFALNEATNVRALASVPCWVIYAKPEPEKGETEWDK